MTKKVGTLPPPSHEWQGAASVDVYEEKIVEL